MNYFNTSRLIRILVPGVVVFCCSSAVSQSDKLGKEILSPFDTLRYEKVVAFDYNGYPQKEIVFKGELIEKARITQKKELTRRQQASLNRIVGDVNTYGGQTAACFDPHLGFVFYNQNKIVGYISVCLACNFLRSSATIPASQSHPSNLCEGCYDYGFSSAGRKKFSRLCKELGFSHWQLNSEIFDK